MRLLVWKMRPSWHLTPGEDEGAPRPMVSWLARAPAAGGEGPRALWGWQGGDTRSGQSTATPGGGLGGRRPEAMCPLGRERPRRGPSLG